MVDGIGILLQSAALVLSAEILLLDPGNEARRIRNLTLKLPALVKPSNDRYHSAV
jgi:hypothetical protein